MAYRSSLNTSHVRPSDDIEPRLKSEKPDYSLAMARYIMSQHMLDRSAIRFSERDVIVRNRRYAEGRQDPNTYKKMLLGDTTGPRINSDDDSVTQMLNAREGLYDVNFEDIFSPAPKYISNIQGMLDGAGFDVEVEAVDENSSTLRQQIKYTDLIEGEYKDFFEYVNTTMGLPGGPKRPIPKNLEELEMFQQMGSYKLAYEIGMAHALKYTDEVSMEHKVKRRVIGDLLTIGKSSVFVYQDSGGITKYRYADVDELIIENSHEEDCSDSTYGGYVAYETVADFRAENPNLTEEQVVEYASKFSGKMGNNAVQYGTENSDGTFPYDQNRIPVLNAYWKAVDTEYKTKHKDGREFYEPYKKGGMRPPKPYDTGNRKTTKTAIRTLYKCKWVCDTDYVYDYGKCTDIPFDYYTKDVKIPFIVFKIPGKPLIEQMIPILDQIQLTFLTLQNAIAKAPPPGLSIEISSLENITIGNKKVTPLDLIKIRTQTGNMLYRLAPPVPGSPIGSQKPIEEIVSGMDTYIASSIKSLELFYMELERITGVSQTAVSSIDPSQGLGVSQINLATTSNTLKPVLIGWQTVKTNAYTYCANKIQSIIVSYPKGDCPYYEVLGAADYASIKSAGEYPPAAWGMFVKAKIDPTTKQALLEAAKAGLSVGKDGLPILSFSDYLYVVDRIEYGGNVSAIRAFIAYREQKAQEEAFQRQQANMQFQAQMTGQTNQAKAQAEQQQKAMDYQMEVGKIREKFQADATLAKVNSDLKIREMAMSKKVEDTEITK